MGVILQVIPTGVKPIHGAEVFQVFVPLAPPCRLKNAGTRNGCLRVRTGDIRHFF
jgi:hypothetical protein